MLYMHEVSQSILYLLYALDLGKQRFKFIFCDISVFSFKNTSKNHQIGSKHMTLKITRFSENTHINNALAAQIAFCRMAWTTWHLQRQRILMSLSMLQLGFNPQFPYLISASLISAGLISASLISAGLISGSSIFDICKLHI